MIVGAPGGAPLSTIGGPMNAGFEYREIVGQVPPGLTVLHYLSNRYRHSTLQCWKERIGAGLILLDSRPAGPQSPVHAGQHLVWRRPPWREPDAPLFFTPLHVDRHILAVAKPAGLATVPAGGFLEHTLLCLVQRIDACAVPVHRLGRWTSGLVVFARTTVARSALARSWRSGSVSKRYRALAGGRAQHGEFAVDCPIGPVPHARLGTVHAAAAEGKPAHSHVTVLEQRDDAFLADVVIRTGRPHQIRIHLAAAGHPLVGDPLYEQGGRPAMGSEALPGDPGYRLHATRLCLPHPADGRPLELTCRPPAALRRAVPRVRTHP